MVERYHPIPQGADRQAGLLAQGFKRISRVEREAPTDPEEIFACIVTTCHLELGVLTLLTLRETPPGQTTKDLAKSIAPVTSRHWHSRTRQIEAYLDRIFIDVSLVAREGYMSTAVGKELFFYALTPFGKQMQGPAYFLLTSLNEVNSMYGSEIALPEILGKSAHGHPRKGENKELLPAKRRGPYLRARVLGELAKLPEERSINLSALADRLNLSVEVVSTHLLVFQKAKLAFYKKGKARERSAVLLTPRGRNVANIFAQVRTVCENPLLLERMGREFAVGGSEFISRNAQLLLLRQKEKGMQRGRKADRMKDLLIHLLVNAQGLGKRLLEERMGIVVSHLLTELVDGGVIERHWSQPTGTEKRSKRGQTSRYIVTSKAREILERHPDISYEDLKALISELS